MLQRDSVTIIESNMNGGMAGLTHKLFKAFCQRYHVNPSKTFIVQLTGSGSGSGSGRSGIAIGKKKQRKSLLSSKPSRMTTGPKGWGRCVAIVLFDKLVLIPYAIRL